MPGSAQHSTISPLDGVVPEWLASARRRGFEAWSSSSMPGPGDEEWKYVDIDFALDDFRPASHPSGMLGKGKYLQATDDESGRVTIVDGFVVSAESDEVTLGGALDVPEDRIAPRYGAAASPAIDIFSAANHAFGPPGAVIIIPAGRAIEYPVAVDVQAVAEGTVSYPHITVIAEAGSEGSVVVVYRSAPEAEVLVSPIVEAFADQNASLSVSVVQHLSGSARMVAHHQYVAGRDATVRIDEVGLGGRYARQRMGIALVGLGSSAKMRGIYFGDHSQVLDYRIYVTHLGPRTTSDIFLKGAVADRAHAVWTGLMRIENPAVGTSAFETNRNLVLSDRAKVHSVPNLEILTDDLQCGHASSSGPLDEEHLYYLMSRGLPRPRAERLLVRGFFNEILSNLATPRLAAPTRTEVTAKFVGALQRASS